MQVHTWTLIQTVGNLLEVVRKFEEFSIVLPDSLNNSVFQKEIQKLLKLPLSDAVQHNSAAISLDYEVEFEVIVILVLAENNIPQLLASSHIIKIALQPQILK